MLMEEVQLRPGGRVSMRTLIWPLNPSLRSAMTLIGSVPARTSGALGSSIRILKGNSSTTATPILSTHVL